MGVELGRLALIRERVKDIDAFVLIPEQPACKRRVAAVPGP